MTASTVALLPVIFGPTWRRNDAGKFVLPDKTLGWHVIDWCEEWLVQPDGADAGAPWRFTNEQKRFLLWWYAIDSRGRFVYRAGMLRRMKGWGKDPFAAAMSLAEMLGPCRFARWGADGEPLAEPHYAACVQIAAVSMDQVKRNTMSLFPAMLPSKTIAAYDLDVGKEIIYAHRGRCRIEMLTSSARSAEGPRPTFILKNETQHWIPSNGGEEMSAVCARNAAKSRDGSTRVLAISNAHAPGEGSDAERDYEAYTLLLQAGKAESTGFMYDSIEAPADVDIEDDDAVTAALEICRGDSYWLDIERIGAEVRDAIARKREGMARRFYLNQLHAGEEFAFDREQWDRLAKPGYVVPAGSLITLGFDGSRARDHTPLIGTEIATGFQWVVGYWVPRELPDGTHEIPVAEVDQAVNDAFSRWEVWRFNADPYYWSEHLAKWAGKYNAPGRDVVVSWSTTNYKRMAFALRNYRDAMEAGDISHDGDPRFSNAIGNAHKLEQQFRDDDGERMWVITKERPDSPLKIDAAVAGCLSWEARRAALEAGAEPDGPSVYETRGALWL